MNDHHTDQSPAPIRSDGSIFSQKADSTTPTAAEVAKGQPMTMNSRWRWAVVGLVTVLVVGLVGAVFVLGQPAHGAPSTVALYAPANTTIYMEARLDFPGDQRDRLASFMSHFPGFADQAAFATKFNETLESIFRQSGTGLDWQADIAPWFGGQIGIFTNTINQSVGTPPPITYVLSVKDRAALDQLIARLTSTGNASQQEYEGQTVWSATIDDVDATRYSFAETNDALVVGTRLERVTAALDARADRAPGLADDKDFLAQLGKLHPDRLAMYYLNLAPLMAGMPRLGLADAMPACVSEQSDLIGQVSNTKLVGEARAESDHIVFTARVSAAPNDLTAPAGYVPANLADKAPADTILFYEFPQLGKTITYLLGRLLDCTQDSSGFDIRRLQTLLGTDLQNFFDFVQDGALVVTYPSGTYQGGIIATVDDEVVASSRVDKLLSYLRPLAFLSNAATIETQEHNGATVTVITLTNPPPNIPIHSVAVSVFGGHLYIGLDDFVTHALDATPSDSLSASPRFQAGLTSAGKSAFATAFVDITAIRSALEAQMPVSDRPDYETNTQPFVAPLDYLMLVGRPDEDVGVTNAFLFVK